MVEILKTPTQVKWITLNCKCGCVFKATTNEIRSGSSTHYRSRFDLYKEWKEVVDRFALWPSDEDVYNPYLLFNYVSCPCCGEKVITDAVLHYSDY